MDHYNWLVGGVRWLWKVKEHMNNVPQLFYIKYLSNLFLYFTFSCFLSFLYVEYHKIILVSKTPKGHPTRIIDIFYFTGGFPGKFNFFILRNIKWVHLKSNPSLLAVYTKNQTVTLRLLSLPSMHHHLKRSNETAHNSEHQCYRISFALFSSISNCLIFNWDIKWQ